MNGIDRRRAIKAAAAAAGIAFPVGAAQDLFASSAARAQAPQQHPGSWTNRGSSIA
jgi:hypothetical protein